MDNNIAKLRARIHYYKQKKDNPDYNKNKATYNKQLYHRRKDEMKQLKELVTIQQELITELERMLE